LPVWLCHVGQKDNMNIYRMVTVLSLLIVYSCQQSPSSSVDKRSTGIIELTADFIEVEGVKTISTITGPHRAIEFILFSVSSPEQFKGSKIIISAEEPHSLPVTKGESIRFRISADHLLNGSPEMNVRVSINDIELLR
jgi:hypothetical protein